MLSNKNNFKILLHTNKTKNQNQAGIPLTLDDAV